MNCTGLKIPVFPHKYTTRVELPSNKSTMREIERERENDSKGENKR